MTHAQSIRGLAARSLVALALAAAALGSTQAAVPGISAGTSGPAVFNLAASPNYISMPDGAQIYSWGYGCGAASNAAAATPGVAPVAPPAGMSVVPSNFTGTTSCGLMQVPGPTLVVTEGQSVTVNLYNGLPTVAGSTSIVFSGFTATATNGVQGQLTQEAAPGTTVSYTFTAGNPGTYAYYSGTRPELQVEMGLYGALVILPANPPKACAADNPSLRGLSGGKVGGTDYRLSASGFAFDHPETCYDREFLFQFAEFDSNVNQAVLACVNAGAACTSLNVTTDPYHPNYFLINGRSFPDDEDPNFSPMYPNQPYNGDPQIHPGETMLLRVVGQGRMQHPFHIHANHGRVVARDGNLLLAANDPLAATAGYSRLAGPLYYTVPTVPGQGQDLLFTFTGKGLNWDMYGHNLNQYPSLPYGPTPATATVTTAGTGLSATFAGTNNAGLSATFTDNTPCFPDANGFFTTNSNPPAPPTVANYYEWCADHNKPIPITPPDPQIVANGLWYGGTPYLGLTQIPLGGGSPQFLSTPLPPGTNIQNPSAGYAYMWHSHAERELTTNNIFPGGMLMMLIVQPPVQLIDETN